MDDNTDMYRIYFPLSEQMLVTGISGPTEMWHAAENLTRSQKKDVVPLEITTIAEQIGPVSCVGGLSVYAEQSFEQTDVADLIVLAPLWGNPRLRVRKSEAMRTWLLDQYHQGAKIIATGTSVCFLAEQGMLDDQPATTHWYYFDLFKKFYPKVLLNQHQFITYADGLYCAGSINALTDLVLYLIRDRYGDDISRVVEQHFAHEINRTFEKPFFTKGSHQHHDEDIIAAQEWAMKNWNKPITQADWSQQVGMSERTLSRRFKLATGMTPLHWVREIKMEKARELLRSTNLPAEEIADATGYNDASYFSRIFSQVTGVTPQKYRIMVRDKLFSAQGLTPD